MTVAGCASNSTPLAQFKSGSLVNFSSLLQVARYCANVSACELSETSASETASMLRRIVLILNPPELSPGWPADLSPRPSASSGNTLNGVQKRHRPQVFFLWRFRGQTPALLALLQAHRQL